MAENAEWAGILAIEEEATIGTENTQAWKLPLTAVPTEWPVAPPPTAVEPVLDNIAAPTDNYTRLGQKRYTITGFESFFTATLFQWLCASLVGDNTSPAGPGLTNVVHSFEWTDSTPGVDWPAYTMVLEMAETAAVGTSRMAIGCIVTEIRLIIPSGNDLCKLQWDVIAQDVGEPTAVPGSYTWLYDLTNDPPKFLFPVVTCTWDTAGLNLIDADLTFSNGITLDKGTKWTDSQTWDELMLQEPNITGRYRIGMDQALGAATIDDDAAARLPKALVLTFGDIVTPLAGAWSLTCPARIPEGLTFDKRDGWQHCEFNWELNDDESTVMTVTTCTTDALKFQEGA